MLTGTLLADFSAFKKEADDSTAALKKLEQGGDSAAAQLNALGKDAPAKLNEIAVAAGKVTPPVQDSAKAFQGLSDQLLTTFAGFVSGEAVIGATTTAIQALTGFVESSVAAYSKQEDATVQLTAALRQHGLGTTQVIDQYSRLATTFQATTKYADEDIQAMEKLLTLVGNVMPSQMQAALKASTDLASGLGMDLEKATMLVAKAAAGHTETLGRYGITVDEADVKSRGFAAVLDTLNDKFGGQAAAQLETYSGKVAQAANAWDNVKEALGKIIVEDPLVTAALNHMVTATKNADSASADARLTIADLAADFGLIDKGTAAAVDGIGIYIDNLNEMAKMQRIAAALPSPFEKWAQDGALPAITAGMELNNKLLKEHEAQVKKDAAALAEWQKATDALSGSTVGWQTTLDTVDGTIVEAIKFYLSAGVSQADLAKAYGLTAQQVAAVKLSLEEYSATLNATADFEKAAAARRIEITHQMTAAVNDQIITTLKAKQADEEFLASALNNAKAQDAAQQQVTAAKQSALQQQANAAKKAYDDAYGDARVSQEKIEQLGAAWVAAQKQANAAVQEAAAGAATSIGDDYTQGYGRSQAASSSFRNSAVAVAAAAAAAAAAATATWESAQGRIDAFNAKQAANPSQVLSTVGMFGGMSYVQTRDSGGPVVAGTPYLIGGGKDPELFVPGASGYVTPGAKVGGGGVTVSNVFHIVDTEANIARRVSDSITRSIMAAQKL